MKSRIAAGAALAVVAIVVIVLLVHSASHGDTYRLVFQTSGQLVKGDDVQIGGRAVGSVKEISLTDDNQAEIKIEVDKEFSPLHRGTTAVIRATSLSGIANRYVSLTPGANSEPTLPNDSLITTEKTTTPVDLDQLFDTLDPAARKHLKEIIQGSATIYAGEAKNANKAYKYLSPALYTTDQVENELLSDQGTLADFLSNSSQLVTALAERRNSISSLVGNTNETMQAIASESQSLDQALAVLPSTVRKANSAFVNLRSTLDDLDVLVAAAKPSTKNLAPFLARLRPLLTEARPTFADLNTAIYAKGKHNDLIDTMRDLPAFGKNLGSASDNTIAALLKAQPVVEFARPYAPELIGWIRDYGQGAAYYDSNGHYVRVAPYTNLYKLQESSNTLTPRAPSGRYDDLEKNFIKPCPGAASQPPADGSAPFTDGGKLTAEDCNPSSVPEGP